MLEWLCCHGWDKLDLLMPVLWPRGMCFLLRRPNFENSRRMCHVMPLHTIRLHFSPGPERRELGYQVPHVGGMANAFAICVMRMIRHQ
jgi:hypothetical protein